MGYKSEVRNWKDGLAFLVKNKLQHLPRSFRSPVSLRFRLFAPTRTKVVDAGNFSKIIEDAIFSVLEFDDNDKHLIRGPYSGVKYKGTGLFAIVLEEIDDMDKYYSKQDLRFFESC